MVSMDKNGVANIELRVNNTFVDVPIDSTVEDVLRIANFPIEEDRLIAIIRDKKKSEAIPRKYVLKTSAGDIIIKVEDQNLWKAVNQKIEGLEAGWRIKRAIAFGPFVTDIYPSKKSIVYERGTVFLTFAGGDPGSCYLAFAVTKYSLVHFTAGSGVVARVISGLKALRSIELGERIEKVIPIHERKRTVGNVIRAGLRDRVQDGDEIYTYLKINLNKEEPTVAEYLMTALENMSLEEITSSFVKFKGFKEKVMEEWYNPGKRLRGAVTIRINGKNRGDIYIYKEDRTPAREHCVAGYVTEGIALVDVARKGDKIEVKTVPERLNIIGLTQAEAGELLSNKGIKQIRGGSINDDAIIVSVYPETTVEILEKGEVTTFGVENSSIIKIKLSKDAPRTAFYFKVASGMVGKKIGQLKVYLKTKDLIIFKPEKSIEEPLIPENTPKEVVRPGEIGVTNMSRKYAGLIGVRLTESKDFGPTAEKFESTNIVGVVIQGVETLKDLKEGDTVYFMEVKEAEE